MCLLASAMAYSATTVFPAEVWAATNTLSLVSKHRTACFWKVSNSNFHYKPKESKEIIRDISTVNGHTLGKRMFSFLHVPRYTKNKWN